MATIPFLLYKIGSGSAPVSKGRGLPFFLYRVGSPTTSTQAGFRSMLGFWSGGGGSSSSGTTSSDNEWIVRYRRRGRR